MNKNLTLLVLMAASLCMSVSRDAAAADVAPATDPILQAVKQTYVCATGAAAGLTIEESEESGALCPEGAKVIAWTQKLISGGQWSKDEIINLVGSLKMGESLIQKNGNADCGEKDNLKLDLFIMSYCPYGVKFITDVLVPMREKLGGTIKISPYFLLGKDQNGKLASGHGPAELEEDLRMICLREKWDFETWMKYSLCFAKDIYGNRTAPKDWKYCAQQAGVDTAKLEACVTKDAPGLAEKDMALSDKYQVQYSPTAVYNCANNVVGAAPFEQMKFFLCRMYSGKKPAACAN